MLYFVSPSLLPILSLSISISLSPPPRPPSLSLTHSQIVGIILVLLSQVLSTPLPYELQQVNQCGSTISTGSHGNVSTLPLCFQESHNNSIPSKTTESVSLVDQQHGVWFFSVMISVVFVFFVVVFRPKYKRVESEKRASFEQSVYVGPLNR